MTKELSEQFNEEETKRRAEAAIIRALNTPHKPHKEQKREAAKPLRAPLLVDEDGQNCRKSE